MAKIKVNANDLQMSMTRAKNFFTQKPKITQLTIPTSGWIEDTSGVSDYKFYYDVLVENLTSDDIVTLNFYHTSASAAADAVLFSSTQSFTDYFRIRAKNIPDAPLDCEYYILGGKS